MRYRKTIIGAITSLAAIAFLAPDVRAWDPDKYYIVGYNLDGTLRCRSGGCGCQGYSCFVCCEGGAQE
jgi:hypothetical protein